MTRPLIVLVAIIGLAAQRPAVVAQSPEERIPPSHYCKRVGVRITERETRAHACDCKYSCSIDESGHVIEHEAPTCLAYCHKDGRRCTCHVEEPCESGGHEHALV